MGCRVQRGQGPTAASNSAVEGRRERSGTKGGGEGVGEAGEKEGAGKLNVYCSSPTPRRREEEPREKGRGREGAAEKEREEKDAGISTVFQTRLMPLITLVQLSISQVMKTSQTCRLL